MRLCGGISYATMERIEALLREGRLGTVQRYRPLLLSQIIAGWNSVANKSVQGQWGNPSVYVAGDTEKAAESHAGIF